MSKWIDLETDASTGKPYLWKCDECGEEVETKWNYCPECGDPKTSKGKSINTLVKALETEHRKLREMQSATDKNVWTNDTISRQAAIEVVQNRHMMLSKEKVLLINDLENLPPAQPKKGKWIYHIDDLFPTESTMECSQCHAEQPLTCDDEFCPHCGADMRGEQYE